MAFGAVSGKQFTSINITPLTDIFLVLAVLMFLVMPDIHQNVLKVDGGYYCHHEHTPLLLNAYVFEDGSVRINDHLIAAGSATTGNLVNAIKSVQTKAGKTDIPLMVQADADAHQKDVVAVMDAACGTGIRRLSVLPLVQKK